jgi:hypothetical protein
VYTRCVIHNRDNAADLQAHPYAYAPIVEHHSSIKALNLPRAAPVPTKASMLHLNTCEKCKKRPPDLMSKMKRRVEAIQEVVKVLDTLHRRLAFQLRIPGGLQQLPACINEILQVRSDCAHVEMFLE